MGRFIYARSTSIEIEDRTLHHLQLVITTKLRRREGFNFTWKEDPSKGGGRTTVWLYATDALIYRYVTSRQPEINRHWVDALAFTANSPSGLYMVHEPAAQVL